MVARGDVRFNAEDRFHPGGFRRLIEFNRAVEVAVVGDGDGLHPELFGAGDELVDLGQSVEE